MTGNDLAAFLLARLDEIERGVPQHSEDCDLVRHGLDEGICDCGVPARVLADCAAKRAVVEVLAKQAAACPPDDWPEDGEIMKAPLADNARHLLRLLVQPYSGHPHFHPSWAVD